jgi:hypothetical protein
MNCTDSSEFCFKKILPEHRFPLVMQVPSTDSSSQYKDIYEPPTAILRIGLLCAIHKTPARFDTASSEIRSIMYYRNPALCRVLFVRHSAKTSLSTAALGKITLSITTMFTESRTLDIDRHSVKKSLSSVNVRRKTTLGKWPLAVVYS